MGQCKPINIGIFPLVLQPASFISKKQSSFSFISVFFSFIIHYNQKNGLKQAPRACYFKIDSFFIENGFERSKNEPTLYFKRDGKSNFLVVCLYVDDIIYMGSSESIVAEFKSCMMKNFEMSDLGLLHYFLGLEVKHGVGGIFISQRKYAKDLLKRFSMLNCKTAPTPMNVNEKLSRDDGAEMKNATYFRSLVGGLNYFSRTRPDIAFSVGVVSRFMHNPSKLHLGAAKRILRYVAGQSNKGFGTQKCQFLS